MACAVRANHKIKGIKINNKEFKISQYADDTCIFVEDESSFLETFNDVEMFSKCSGLTINQNKSEALHIGPNTKNKHKLLKIKWPEKYVKYLGIYISNNKEEVIEKNFKEKLDKVETILQSWGLRNLSLKGKITVVNTIAISNMIYVSSVIHTPKWVIKKFKSIITNFIWDGKPAKIKYSNLIMSVENGGLRLQDYETKINSILIKWIKEMNKDYSVPWKEYIGQSFDVRISEIPCLNLDSKDMPVFSEELYNDIFRTWAQLHFHKPEYPDDIMRQIIWSNSCIKIGKKVCKSKKYHQAGIKYMKDLVNNQCKVIKKTDLEDKYNVKFTGLEYESIISAIPNIWKKTIKEINKDSIHISPYVAIRANNTYKKLCETDTKEIYWIMIEKIGERATSEKSWKDETELNLTQEDWQTIYCSAYKVPTDAKLNTFNYKITHRILACQQNLCRWKIKQSGKCLKCNEEDTIEHHLVECPEVQKFWKQIFNWWRSISKIEIPIHTYEILFLYPNDNNQLPFKHFNFILLHGLYYTYANKQKNKELDPYEFKSQIKQRLKYEQEISVRQSREKAFEKDWSIMLENI